MKTKNNWNHQSSFLTGPDADRLYRRMLIAPWSQPDADKMSACVFGLTYTQGGGGARGESPNIPDFLKALAERVAWHQHVQMPSNYIQCHRASPSGIVQPHRDPSGMIVPMLTLGQERTFRVGGDYPNAIPKTQRPVECHHPDEEILMKSGDLLVFNGGRTAHSMFPAERDSQFNANGCDYRISILFRWTTSIMRSMGPDRRRWSPMQMQQHETEYAAAREKFLEEHQMQESLF
jgi:hypothetical protein